MKGVKNAQRMVYIENDMREIGTIYENIYLMSTQFFYKRTVRREFENFNGFHAFCFLKCTHSGLFDILVDRL